MYKKTAGKLRDHEEKMAEGNYRKTYAVGLTAEWISHLTYAAMIQIQLTSMHIYRIKHYPVRNVK